MKKYFPMKYSYIARKNLGKLDPNSNYSPIMWQNVIFCQHCHQMSDLYKCFVLEEGEEIPAEQYKKHIWNGYDYIFESIGDFVEAQAFNDYGRYNNAIKEFLNIFGKDWQPLKFKRKSKNIPVMICPKCQQEILHKDTIKLSREKSWISKNAIVRSYEIKEDEDQISLRADLTSVYAVVDYEKVKYFNTNVRFVFSKKDHNVYAFQVYDTDKNVPWKLKASNINHQRIINITYLSNSFNFLTPIHLKVMEDKRILNALEKYFDEMYGEKAICQENFQSILLRFRYHSYNYDTREMIKKLITDTPKLKKRNAQKKKVLLQDLYKMQDNQELFMKTLKQKKCPNKKQFKKLAIKNPLYIYMYRFLTRIGLKNYDIIMQILNSSTSWNYQFIEIMYDLCTFEGQGEEIKEFLKDIISAKGDAWAKKNIFDFEKEIEELRGVMFRDYTEFLSDVASLWLTVKGYLKGEENESIKLEDHIEPLLKMHDNLRGLLRKLKNKNYRIPYKKEEMNLNCKIGDYTFALAPDTYSLIECGDKMGICVGGYEQRAIKRADTIVFIIKDYEFVGCIELIEQNSVLLQAKAKFNNMLQEEKALALKQWIETNNINASQCQDYRHIRMGDIKFDKDNIYQGVHNYCVQKQFGDDEVGNIADLKYDYLIEDKKEEKKNE